MLKKIIATQDPWKMVLEISYNNARDENGLSDPITYEVISPERDCDKAVFIRNPESRDKPFQVTGFIALKKSISDSFDNRNAAQPKNPLDNKSAILPQDVFALNFNPVTQKIEFKQLVRKEFQSIFPGYKDAADFKIEEQKEDIADLRSEQRWTFRMFILLGILLLTRELISSRMNIAAYDSEQALKKLTQNNNPHADLRDSLSFYQDILRLLSFSTVGLLYARLFDNPENDEDHPHRD